MSFLLLCPFLILPTDRLQEHTQCHSIRLLHLCLSSSLPHIPPIDTQEYLPEYLCSPTPHRYAKRAPSSKATSSRMHTSSYAVSWRPSVMRRSWEPSEPSLRPLHSPRKLTRTPSALASRPWSRVMADRQLTLLLIRFLVDSSSVQVSGQCLVSCLKLLIFLFLYHQHPLLLHYRTQRFFYHCSPSLAWCWCTPSYSTKNFDPSFYLVLCLLSLLQVLTSHSNFVHLLSINCLLCLTKVLFLFLINIKVS